MSATRSGSGWDWTKFSRAAGFGHNTRLLTQIMTLNRLIEPSSELAMSEWVWRSALGDILKEDFAKLDEDRLYRNMDRLHGKRGPIEAALCAKEKSLFSLKKSILLYDLTSTYFEGLCLSNPKAKRGYSRDKRPDCKQVVVGLVLDSEGFPKAHEIFAGNRVLELLHLLWSTGCRDDSVTAIDQFLENDAACLTCGSVENDFQLELPYMGLRIVKINSIQLFRKVKEKSEPPTRLSGSKRSIKVM